MCGLIRSSTLQYPTPSTFPLRSPPPYKLQILFDFSRICSHVFLSAPLRRLWQRQLGPRRYLGCFIETHVHIVTVYAQASPPSSPSTSATQYASTCALAVASSKSSAWALWRQLRARNLLQVASSSHHNLQSMRCSRVFIACDV
jgi:hypothetical protein